MERKYDLSDLYERMKYRELMLTNWCQKKYRHFAKQLEEYAPYGDGVTDLLLGLCYQHGWGVWRNKDTARQYFSGLRVGKTVWFGHGVTFMECEIIKIEADRILLREKDPHPMNKAFVQYLVFPPAEVAPWDSCLARKWMNSVYYENTFYKQERDLILKVRITTPDNPYTGVKYAGKECQDKVFPLSMQEYIEYMGWTGKVPELRTITASIEGPEAVAVRAGHYVTRITKRTKEYPVLNFGYDLEEFAENDPRKLKGAFFRTPGNSSDSKAFEINGIIFHEGETKDKTLNKMEIGYKPAFWVSLK